MDSTGAGAVPVIVQESAYFPITTCFFEQHGLSSFNNCSSYGLQYLILNVTNVI